MYKEYYDDGSAFLREALSTYLLSGVISHRESWKRHDETSLILGLAVLQDRG